VIVVTGTRFMNSAALAGPSRWTPAFQPSTATTASMAASAIGNMAPQRGTASKEGGSEAWGEIFGSILVELPWQEVRQTSNRPATLPCVEPHQPPVEALDLTTILQALGDPVRLKIVRELAATGEQVCGAMEVGVSKSTRSHHFKTLREAGVTDTRVEGTHRHVSLRRDDLEARFPGLLDAVLQTQAAPA
jgi:DNA-binding transcriptional ArsR family regulator